MNTSKTYTDEQLRKIAKDSKFQGTFKLVRSEILLNDELPPVHRAILEATKTLPAVYKLLTEKAQKVGKDKDKFFRLGVLRAINNNEKELQELIGAITAK